MLVGVTTREDISTTLNLACRAGPLHGGPALKYQHCRTLATATEHYRDAAILVLDLLECAKDPVTLQAFIATTRTENPSCEIVVIRTMTQALEDEGALLFQLGGLGVRETVRPADALRRETWLEFILDSPIAALLDTVRVEYNAALSTLPASFPNRKLIQQILLLSLNTTTVNDLVIALTKSPTTVDSDRQALWRVLYQSNQLGTKEMHTTFRMLYYAKLQQFRWPALRVAKVMGFAGDDVQCRRALRSHFKERAGLAVNDLKAVTYEEVFRWCVGVTTASYPRAIETPGVKELVAPLLALARERKPTALGALKRFILAEPALAGTALSSMLLPTLQ